MKKPRGKHHSGQSGIGSWADVILFFGLLLGFLFLVGLLPDPWDRYFVATVTLLGCFYFILFIDCKKRIRSGKSRKKSPSSPTSDQKLLSEKVIESRLHTAKTLLSLYTAVVGVTWFFLDVPYRLFSTLALLPLPVLMALYFLFPQYTTLEEPKGTGERLSLCLPMLASCVVPAFRTLMDFNFLNWFRLLFLSLFLFAVMAALFLCFSREWLVTKSLLLTILMILVMYAPSAIGQLNLLLDRSIPTRETAIVSDKHISRSTRAPDSYILTLLPDSGGTLNLETAPDHYHSLTPGDTVTISTYEGGLNIPYALAE